MRALLLGMSIAVAGSTVAAIVPETDVRRMLIAIALVLMAVGYASVANQITGWRRSALIIIAILQLVWLGWVFARPYLALDANVMAAVWWSGIVLLAIAAWKPPWGIVAGVIAVVLECPWLSLLEPLDPWDRPARELVTSAAIVVMVRGILK